MTLTDAANHHPYFPLDLHLPDYVALQVDFTFILGVFTTAVALVFGVTWILSGGGTRQAHWVCAGQEARRRALLPLPSHQPTVGRLDGYAPLHCTAVLADSVNWSPEQLTESAAGTSTCSNVPATPPTSLPPPTQGGTST